MKYGLLVTSPVGPDKNIGDYMQSIAAMQFLPQVDSYLEKESICDFKTDEPTKAIMNAWYIWHPENWPPKEDNLIPLMTSVHIMPAMLDKMLENGGFEYFKKYEPIGCRDTNTAKMLQSKGIQAYFSGCMTLTLGVKYKKSYQRKGVIFVDPYIPPLHVVSSDAKLFYWGNALRFILYFFKNPFKSVRLSKIRIFQHPHRLISLYKATMFYHTYSKLFTDDVLFCAEYLSHMIPVGNHKTQEDWIRTAEMLLDKYSRAAYVVTSRIHCALPCLGIDTPVIFTLGDVMKSDKNLIGSPGRYGGLLDFFRVADYQNNRMETNDEILSSFGKLSRTTVFENKPDSKIYKETLIKSCIDFIKSAVK